MGADNRAQLTGSPEDYMDDAWAEVPSMSPPQRHGLKDVALAIANDDALALKSTHLNEQNQGPPTGRLIKTSESSSSFQ